MADVRQYIRINPLDTDTDIAIGVSLPFDGTAVFNSTYTTKDQMKSNLLNVILTEPGERLFKPNFGVGLRNYLFENFTDIESLESRIQNQVDRYVPQAELLKADVIKTLDSHELNVRIFYRTRIDGENNVIQVNFSQDNTSNINEPSLGGSGGY